MCINNYAKSSMDGYILSEQVADLYFNHVDADVEKFLFESSFCVGAKSRAD